jgi:hypothetical protein
VVIIIHIIRLLPAVAIGASLFAIWYHHVHHNAAMRRSSLSALLVSLALLMVVESMFWWFALATPWFTAIGQFMLPPEAIYFDPTSIESSWTSTTSQHLYQMSPSTLERMRYHHIHLQSSPQPSGLYERLYFEAFQSNDNEYNGHGSMNNSHGYGGGHEVHLWRHHLSLLQLPLPSDDTLSVQQCLNSDYYEKQNDLSSAMSAFTSFNLSNPYQYCHTDADQTNDECKFIRALGHVADITPLSIWNGIEWHHPLQAATTLFFWSFSFLPRPLLVLVWLPLRLLFIAASISFQLLAACAIFYWWVLIIGANCLRLLSPAIILSMFAMVGINGGHMSRRFFLSLVFCITFWIGSEVALKFQLVDFHYASIMYDFVLLVYTRIKYRALRVLRYNNNISFSFYF